MAAEVLRKLRADKGMPGEAYVFKGPRSDRLSHELTAASFESTADWLNSPSR